MHFYFTVLASLLASGTCVLLRCPDESLTVPYFFDCMRRGLDEDYDAYENEYISALTSTINQCFNKCSFTQNDFKVDAFNDIFGPMKNCDKCLFYTESIGDFFVTAAKSNSIKLTKFRHYVGDTLAKDLTTCMGNFAFAKTPDIEAGESKNMPLKLQAVGLISKAYSRIGMCSINNENDAKSTTQCFLKERNLFGKMPKHCNRLNYCATNELTKFCCHRIKASVEQTCKCMGTKESQYVNTFKEMSEYILKAKNHADCLSAWNFVSSDGIDWMTTIDDVVSSLIPNVKLSDVLTNICDNLKTAMDEGDEAKEEEIRINTSGLLAFAGNTFAGFYRHMTDRFCHCDIDCSEAHSLTK